MRLRPKCSTCSVRCSKYKTPHQNATSRRGRATQTHTPRAALARARRRSSSDVGPIEALSLELRTTPPIFVEGEVERVVRRVPVIRVRLGRDRGGVPAEAAEVLTDLVEALGIDSVVEVPDSRRGPDSEEVGLCVREDELDIDDDDVGTAPSVVSLTSTARTLSTGRATHGTAWQPPDSSWGTIDIPQDHIAKVEAVDKPDGFLPTQVRGWLLLRSSRLGPQERAAILSGTAGDTTFSKVAEKLRSQWSDSDLVHCDKNRKGFDRRQGAANAAIGGEDEDDVRIMLGLSNNTRADHLDADQLASDLEFILVAKAKIGSEILHRVQNAKSRGGIMMYAEVYRWFTETSGLGLAEQSAQLMNPKTASKEEDVAGAIERWEDKSSRLARHGADYVLPAAYKKVALKKILTSKIKETFELWETEKLPFHELLKRTGSNLSGSNHSLQLGYPRPGVLGRLETSKRPDVRTSGRPDVRTFGRLTSGRPWTSGCPTSGRPQMSADV